MKKIYDTISKMLRRTAVVTTAMTDEEYYYSQSSNLVDLERRMREVEKGLAPFQNGMKVW